MLKKLGYYIRRPGYYLSVAYYDISFKIFFSILIIKLIFFTYINQLGIDSFFSSFGIIVAALSLSLLLQKYILKIIYLSSLNIVCSFLFFIHSLYLSYFDDFASVYHLHQVHLLKDVLDVVVMILKKEVLFIIDLIFLPFLVFKIKWENDYNLKDKIMAVLLLVSLCIYCNISPYISKLPYTESIYNRYNFVNHRGLFVYQIVDLYYYFLTSIQRTTISKENTQLIADWYKEKNKKRISENNLTGIGKGFNLIIIQVESLQKFVIKRTHDGNEITPNLNKLVKEGIYFNNIYDQTAAGGSSDAILLANSSLYPSRKGAVSYLYFQNCFDSLPKILKENGYTTATLHAYKKNFWNSEAFEKSLGFQYQFYEDAYITNDKIGGFLKGPSDKSFFSQSVEKINTMDIPFYAFLRTLSTHAPFAHISSDLDSFSLGNLDSELIGYYIRSMHYVDSAIGKFLNKLSENNLLENTIIVVYGDHRSRIPLYELKKIGIEDVSEKKKIPFIIYLPNKNIGIESSTIGGLIDVTPTICNILGIDISDKFFLGKDLTNSDKSYVIFRDGKYISHNKSMNKINAQKQLMISDVILEKDIIHAIKTGAVEVDILSD